MKENLLGRKVKIVDAPEKYSHLIGQRGTICSIDGFSIEKDLVSIKLSAGGLGFCYIYQLEFIDK